MPADFFPRLRAQNTSHYSKISDPSIFWESTKGTSKLNAYGRQDLEATCARTVYFNDFNSATSTDVYVHLTTEKTVEMLYKCAQTKNATDIINALVPVVLQTLTHEDYLFTN